MTGVARTAAFALVTGLLLSSAAISTESGLMRCAAIADADARLVCYDALAGQATRKNAPAPAPAPDRAVAAPTDPAAASRNFGLSAAQQHTVDQGPKAIQAHVTRVIVNQNRRSYLVLDNDQTWAITEGEMLLDSGEAVTISHGALGSFMLTSASNHSYQVRRIR